MIISNKNILITGGLGSLGLQMFKRLNSLGANLIILDLNKTLVNLYKNKYKKHLFLATDLSQKKNIDSVFRKIKNKKINIDILINNVGLLFNEPIISFSRNGIVSHRYSSFKKVINLNLTSTFYLSSLVIKNMIDSKKAGCIINVSSISAAGNVGQSAYSASKAGLNALTKTWSKELSFAGIRVNSISPGFINTKSTKKIMNSEKLKNIVTRSSAKRLGRAEEVVSLITHIITNDYINGSILNIDGGLDI